MIAVLGKNHSIKKGTILIFGQYGGEQLLWHVIDTKPRENMALIFADSYCGKASYSRYSYVKQGFNALFNEWFSEDEQTFIHWSGALEYEHITKYRLSKDDLKFFPDGTKTQSKGYFIESNYSDDCYICFITSGGEYDYRSYCNIDAYYRPLMWVKYDCIPVKKEEKEKKK